MNSWKKIALIFALALIPATGMAAIELADGCKCGQSCKCGESCKCGDKGKCGDSCKCGDKGKH